MNIDQCPKPVGTNTILQSDCSFSYLYGRKWVFRQRLQWRRSRVPNLCEAKNRKQPTFISDRNKRLLIRNLGLNTLITGLWTIQRCKLREGF